MHSSGKRFQFTCAIPNITVLQRMGIESRLKKVIPAHSVVVAGDTDYDENKRLHVFTNNPPGLANILGKVLDEHGVDIQDCRCHVRNLQRQEVHAPGQSSMDAVEARGMVEFFDKGVTIIAEALRKHEGKPDAVLTYVKRHFSLLACNHHALRTLPHSGFNFPAADEHGLVNLWQIALANRKMFPSLFDPEQQRPGWQGKRPRAS